jgi:hypothetical protein
MRRSVQILFLIFYLASSYAVSQERTTLLVADLQHCGSRGDDSSIDPGSAQLQNDFPNFRQAKPKGPCVLYFERSESVSLLPLVSKRSFHPLTYSLQPLYLDANVLSRPPPV